MRSKLLLILTTLGILSATFNAFADAITNSLVAVQGYDVVSYFKDKKPVPGNGNHVAEYEGVTYQFASEKHKEVFLADPEKYIPQYGGWCAFGVAVGKKLVGDPNVWKIVDGRLYLNLDKKIQGMWKKDIPGNIEKAEGNWPKIKDKPAAEL